MASQFWSYRLTALLCILSQLGYALAKAGSVGSADKSIFDVGEEGLFSATGAMEFLWRIAKVCFAGSPLIAIVCLLCSGEEDKEAEELRRSKKFDFQMQGAGD